MRYYTKRQFDSNIHIYEFSPTECDSVIEFGKPGQYEPLSAIKNTNKIAAGNKELAKINLGFFGTTEHHGSVFNPSTISGSAEGKGVECYLTQDGQFVVCNITDKQISNLKGNVQWGCSLSYAVVVNGKKGFTGSSNYSHFGQRNPRTLIGQKADKTMVLAVVEGRSSTSKGVTGDQSADIMLGLGCINVINADGGGSSEMMVDGKIVNQLADGTERKIGSALIVYGKENKQMTTQIKGIDVSHHQGNIDWKKVAAEGVKFAFIKASEGYTFVDSKFKTNVDEANAAGIKTGAYHYAKFSTVAEALAEAKHFISVIAAVNLTYPVVLDLEEDKKKAGKKVLTEAALAFINMVKATGRTVLLYSGKSFLESNLDESKLKDIPLWVARYNSTLGRSADIWQHSDKGIVPGILGHVDLNWAYRDLSAKPKSKEIAYIKTGSMPKDQAEEIAQELKKKYGWKIVHVMDV
jgi:GH25 family lysozyme M1 (1,4-beta-N-acetylmuramidase)